MKRYGKWLLMLVTGSVITVLLAGCGPRHHSPEERADWVTKKITSELELDDTQSAKLATLKTEMLEAGKVMKQRRDDSVDIIKGLLEQPTLDRNQALNLVESHTRTINDQAPRVVAALGDFYDSLRPEQQARLREKLQEFQQHRDQGWRRWH
jgi:Spy/CpxP family protein refolding chaperone